MRRPPLSTETGQKCDPAGAARRDHCSAERRAAGKDAPVGRGEANPCRRAPFCYSAPETGGSGGSTVILLVGSERFQCSAFLTSCAHIPAFHSHSDWPRCLSQVHAWGP
jgi:hypothetical protein